jgi:hypothetical protein
MESGDLVYVSGHDRCGFHRSCYGILLSSNRGDIYDDYLWTWRLVLVGSEIIEVHEDFVRPTRTTERGII